jgi:hypothetical protein
MAGPFGFAFSKMICRNHSKWKRIENDLPKNPLIFKKKTLMILMKESTMN